MIETFFGRDTLSAPQAMLAALVIGFAFGFALERAGFGSSRRLAGIFYFRDMTVLKVMFSAVIVAMIGLQCARALGWISDEQIYMMPSIYGAQIIGGLMLGVGFAVGAWCPGTAAVGAAAGRLDALVFLGGAAIGSILFNEMFPLVKGLQTWGDRGVQFAWQNLGMSSAGFGVVFTLVAIGAFWGAEYIERRRAGTGVYWRSPFLKAYSIALVTLAAGMVALQGPGGKAAPSERALLASVEAARDHIEPEELASRLMAGEPGLLVVDVRGADEYDRFHIRGAVRIAMADLPAALAAHKNRGVIVLYSNGMTHPAQARDALARLGFNNVYMLTDGLVGFAERVMKPVSLRPETLPAAETTRVNTWRRYFSGQDKPVEPAAALVAPLPVSQPTTPAWPGLVEPAWLAQHLGKPDIRVLDVRLQPQYNTGHIPGSVCVSPEHFRGVVGGVSSMLLPADVLARLVGLMGIQPADTVIIVPEEKIQDATLVGQVFARLGHARYGVLNGGFARWTAEKRPVTTELSQMTETRYPAPAAPDAFSVDYKRVLDHMKKGDAVILDVRPEEYFTGKKIEEARGGHIPGAKNRPYTEDVAKTGAVAWLKPADDLARAYAQLIPDKNIRVIVHCRTGHQASQTFFVLRNLLGYKNVLWYDASWSEWAARSELPVTK